LTKRELQTLLHHASPAATVAVHPEADPVGAYVIATVDVEDTEMASPCIWFECDR
jgi:hypothetical protein